ncbi:hypothetical protein CVO74_20070 [Xanthomonas prunicola]|uniref:Uncharacterized protein n=1 Tax=Xanthomonas prunicola TaxID=2053930 RepID=A0ABX4RFL9_9XANT|nr:hypothetical protein XpruCFBP8354_21845 [Xanthomonas prunicola]PKV19775.1 hypothetical protein CVO74_20070 [Xanthomonas prunicola]
MRGASGDWHTNLVNASPRAAKVKHRCCGRAWVPVPSLQPRPALAARALQGTRASGVQAVPYRPAGRGAKGGRVPALPWGDGALCANTL